MALPREKATLQERFGFGDRELSTPRHDAIMVWLNGHIPEFVAAQEKPSRWDVDQTTAKFNDAFAKWRAGSQEWWFYGMPDFSFEKAVSAEMRRIPEAKPSTTIEITWEYVVTNNRDFTIGFIDMKVDVSFPVLGVHIPASWTKEQPSIFVDRHPERYLFEVKPSIPSAGELLRQIRLYEANAQGHYYVVSPDDRFRPIIEAQRIGFILCPEPT